MLIIIICLLVSYIPCMMLYVYLKRLKKDDHYSNNCRNLFWRGFLATLPVIGIALVLNVLWALFVEKYVSPLINDAFHDIVLAAFNEELCKGLQARRIIFKDKESVSWLDVIAYSSIVGIGFHVIESAVYALGTSPIQIIVRGISGSHGTLGLIMGYYLGKAMHTGDRKYNVLSFLVPFVIHALYNFSLADSFQALSDLMVFIPFIMVGITLFALFRILCFIKKNRNNALYTSPLGANAVASSETAVDEEF